MFNFVPYKKRNQYLTATGLLFALCIYLFAIKNTISEYNRNKTLKYNLSKAQIAPHDIKSLQKKIDDLDRKLNFSIADTLKNQDIILDVISELCRKNSLILKEFSAAVLQQKNDLVIETNVILIEGNFHNLTKLIYELENYGKIGKLASLTFNTHWDNNKKKTILYLKIYLQNISPSTNA